MICKECGLRKGTTCLISNRIVPDLNHAACPWGRRENTIRTCDYCGRNFEDLFIDMTNEEPIFICENCFSQFNTCNRCTRVRRCAFTEDQTSPDFIMKQFRQDNQIIQIQVKNPDKIDIYCRKCGCWDNDYRTCMREYGFCKNYKENR